MRLRQAVGQTAKNRRADHHRRICLFASGSPSAWTAGNILPDGQRGLPLHLSPPGRFLRHVADLFRVKLDSEALVNRLREAPCLTHSGGDRNIHQL